MSMVIEIHNGAATLNKNRVEPIEVCEGVTVYNVVCENTGRILTTLATEKAANEYAGIVEPYQTPAIDMTRSRGGKIDGIINAKKRVGL